jgi:K+/H+ antiporter YhaU regulatory subunit KhtT
VPANGWTTPNNDIETIQIRSHAMSLLDKIKESWFQGKDKVTDVTEQLVERGKKVGTEGVEATQEIFMNISERTSDVAAMVKIKHELASFPELLDEEALTLGELVLTLHRGGEFSSENETFQNQLKKLEELDSAFKSKRNEYEKLKKKHSSNYVIEKLSEDLSSANAIIDQVIISDQSNVVDKLLKEILLPKEALVSAIKREEEVIIPDGNTTLKAGDQVIVIGKIDDVKKIVKRFSAT